MSIEGFAEELRESLNPHVSDDEKLVQKGMMLYRQGLVSQVRFDGDQRVLATVQDVMPVKVELDLNFLLMSTCTCPAEGVCRHMLAAFFAAYSRSNGSVAEWVETWRSPVREVKQFSQWGLQRAKDLVKGEEILKPDYGRWVQSMERSFDSIMKSKPYSNPYIIVELFKVYERRVLAGMPLEPEWKTVYELIANVVSFRKLVMLSEEMGHTAEGVTHSYLYLIHQLIDDAEETAAKIAQRPLPFDFDAFIEPFPADTNRLLTCVQGFEYERMYLYRMLWTEFFRKRVWREAEMERIKGNLKRLPDWANPLPLMLAEIHQSLMLGEDEEALRLMGLIENHDLVPYLLYWIDFFSGQRLWSHAATVVDVLVAKVRAYLDSLGSSQACSSFTRLAMKSISHYCVETGRAEVYERALMQTLPYSFFDYEQLLFTRAQYDKWAELNTIVGILFSDLPKDRIKVIEKEKPEALFALLHQTVQREIDLKNRSSYKAAVRHLKKLRTLYKKTKRVSDWELFLEILLEKTKRLRAFHEECKRSKLIDA